MLLDLMSLLVKTGRLLKRHTLWLGFAAVLVPLLILLALQYRWLVKLDRTTAIAHQAALDNYLEAVSAEVRYFYRNVGERTLNISAPLFTQHHMDRVAHYFKAKGPEGVSKLFVVSFVGVPDGETVQPLFCSLPCPALVPLPDSPEERAVSVAMAPWRVLAVKAGAMEHVSLAAEERDLTHRIILNPITDDSSRVVGLAGMILDEPYFRQRVLPGAIGSALPKYFSHNRQEDPIVSVWDGKAQPVYSTEAPADPSSDERGYDAERAFSFVFTDWHIGISSRYETPEQWARRNFAINIGLSAVLAAVLLSGILMALRAASREMKLSQMKSDFVSNVSHELRTPVASIRVFGEFLKLGRVDNPEKVRGYGEYIEAESRRLTQLINNILDFSSIEAGRKSYRFESVSLEKIVGETLKTFEVRLRQRGFSIIYDGPPKPLPPVPLDPIAIAQSLSNLLDNAVKYSNGPESGKEITVRLRREKGSAVITVEDQGIGIPRSEQRKIFDRFHRVSTGLIHDVKGSGLGLAIVRHIALAHHGQVTVESRPGEGSTFSIYLPLEPELELAASETTPAISNAQGLERPSEA